MPSKWLMIFQTLFRSGVSQTYIYRSDYIDLRAYSAFLPNAMYLYLNKPIYDDTYIDLVLTTTVTNTRYYFHWNRLHIWSTLSL